MIGLIGVRDTLNDGTLHSVLANGLQDAGFSTNAISYAATKRFDAVLAFAKGFHDYFQAGQSLSNSTPTCDSCSGKSIMSAHGDTLMNFLKQVKYKKAIFDSQFEKRSRNSLADHNDKDYSYIYIFLQVQTNGASHFLNFSSNGSPGISNFDVVNLQSNGWHTVREKMCYI